MAIKDETASDILSKCARHCCICRKFRPLHLQIHHLVEQKVGGDDNFDNLIALCTYCHPDVHTVTMLTRRFTIEELKKHRDSVYELVAKGKLPSSETIISGQDIDYIVDQITEKLNARLHTKYNKSSLQILYAAAVEEKKIITVQPIRDEKDEIKSSVILVGGYEFISELNESKVPKLFSELIDSRLIEKVSQYEYKVTLKGLALIEEEFDTYDRFTMVKSKCLNCSLHFTICTWFPEKHTKDNICCPECGEKNGAFLVWKQKVFGFIFQTVPGNAKLEM